MTKTHARSKKKTHFLEISLLLNEQKNVTRGQPSQTGLFSISLFTKTVITWNPTLILQVEESFEFTSLNYLSALKSFSLRKRS